jgi:hypothetical protein
MIAAVLAGLVIVLAVFVTLCRIMPLRRWLGYATLLDIVFMLGMLSMFHGTWSGVLAATCAGLFMALALTLLRKALGYERLVRTGWRMAWKPTAPTWHTKLASVRVPKFNGLWAKLNSVQANWARSAT